MAVAVRTLSLFCPLALALCVRDAGHRAGRPQDSARETATPASTGTAHDATAGHTADVTDAGQPAAPVAPSSLARVIESVRHENWREARSRIDALPDDAKTTREARYLDGRVSLALNDFERAATALHNLSDEIPALGTEIQRLEASALARAGRNAEARALYQRIFTHTHAERDAAMAAEQALEQGDVRAAAAVMHTWPSAPPAGIDRARAWRHAATALAGTADRAGAVQAWKRILIDEPDSAAATEASAGLSQQNATLDPDEVLSRAAHLNERARYTDSIAELSAMPAQQGAREARRLHLLGRGLFYARNRYLDAHNVLLSAAARSDNDEHEEDAFLAARALSRLDRDDEAVVAYDQVARTIHGRWSDEAAFRAAWILGHHEHPLQAIERFREFLRDRSDANAQLRSESAWEMGWSLYQLGRFAEAATALEQSSTLATRSLERGRGRYWQAMAKLRSGNATDAQRIWEGLLAERPLTYYALLAEARLRERNVAVAPPAEPAPRRSAPALELPENVIWLRSLGFEREGGALLAAQEDTLRAHLPRDRADEAIALGYLELGEPYRAYTLAQRHNDLLDHEPTAETRWIWDCAYPRPYAHWVEAAEDSNHLPRQYLYAIMRQESAFNPHDVSNARAIGLLQMIPPTTRNVAQELGIEYREELLFEPEYNIRTAGYYIGRLFGQYHGVMPRSIGSFNAGPNVMTRWVTRWPDVEQDIFVERIPFDETRTYVRRVLQNFVRYRYLYGPRDEWPIQFRFTADPTVEHTVEY